MRRVASLDQAKAHRYPNVITRLAIETKLAFEMTLTEWKKYHKDHPDADKSNHTITEDTADKDAPIEHKAPKQRKNQVKITKQELKETLGKGHFTVVSAGRNPSHEAEKNMAPDAEFFKKRTEQLHDELDELGVPYTPVIGHYGGEENSFLVFHDDEEQPAPSKKTQKSFIVKYGKEEAKDVRGKLEKIGKKYNQDSVLHGAEGKNTIKFTTGKNDGKECGGKGWKETPEAEDFFTDIELKDREHSKFNLDISGCFDEGYF